MLIEKRTTEFESEVTDSGDDRGWNIIGHASVYDRLSENLGGFREKIAKGAFDEAIDSSDVRALINHDPNLVLGRWLNGNPKNTLELRDDKFGLRVFIKPPNTTYANDLKEVMERGDVSQMSFAFTVSDDEWLEKDGEVIRTIRKIDRLFDVSVVTYPAYPQTDASVRSVFQKALEDGSSAVGVMDSHELTRAAAHDEHEGSEVAVADLKANALRDLAIFKYHLNKETN